MIGVKFSFFISGDFFKIPLDKSRIKDYSLDYLTDNCVWIFDRKTNTIYSKGLDGTITFNNPTKYLRGYFGSQGKSLKEDLFEKEDNNKDVFIDTL